MLLRNTISSTKKFFNKTFQSFRSLLSTGGGGYQRLPKSSTFNNYLSCGGVVADDLKTHQDFRWEDSNHINRPKVEKEPAMKDQDEIYNEGFKKFSKKRLVLYKTDQDSLIDDDELLMEKKREFVKQKLKEMVLMDLRNVEHVMDIEKVLYYYSHITCPVYVEIVNNFFMEMYLEFFIHQQT